MTRGLLLRQRERRFHGGYGHSSVFDEQRNLIYLFGGYHSGSQSSYNLTDVLYSYSPKHVKW